MLKKNKKSARNVVPIIYVIEVITNTKNAYYKVGFTDVEDNSRPLRLIKEYKELHPESKISLLKTFILPIKKGCYFDDNMVRAEMVDTGKVQAVDPAYIARIIGVDGKNEFIEVLDSSINVVDKVEEAINTLAQDKDNFKYKIRNILVYNAEQTHKITGELITNIENYLGYRIADKYYGKCLLFIGQPDSQWLASLALTNKVVCLTDDADERPVFSYPALNDAITYANKIEEIINMKLTFDLIISNPPYGQIGANITDIIRQQIDYKEFVNLLPANDYKRNDNKDLYNYQSDMQVITDGFADANVTTHLAKISKTRVNGLTYDEFEISLYTDKSLDKYFIQNVCRVNNTFDNCDITGTRLFTVWNHDTTFILSSRAVNHKHLSYSKRAFEYRWNVLKEVQPIELKTANYDQLENKQGRHITSFAGLIFKTAIEKENFTNFVYSTNGFKFVSKLFEAMNKDSWVAVSYWAPKVDWTRAWTVEEILADYGYTADEIAEVMNSLNKLKGMED